ncbi:hypothetical protein BH10BDE1_BH10BDE1_35010 [soil metagenome]
MTEFRRLPDDYGMVFLTTAWKITKKHYEMILGTSLIILVVVFALSMVPYLGLLASIPALILGIGQMRVVRGLIEGRKVQISEVFYIFQDQKLLSQIMPLALSGVVIAILQFGVTKLTANNAFFAMVGSLVNLFLLLTWLALTAFSGPLIAFQGHSFADSIDMNIKATTLNWWPLLLFAIMLLGFGLICLIVFFLPVIFIFLPTMFVTSYLCYAAMFENLDVVALAKTL